MREKKANMRMRGIHEKKICKLHLPTKHRLNYAGFLNLIYTSGELN